MYNQPSVWDSFHCAITILSRVYSGHSTNCRAVNYHLQPSRLFFSIPRLGIEKGGGREDSPKKRHDRNINRQIRCSDDSIGRRRVKAVVSTFTPVCLPVIRLWWLCTCNPVHTHTQVTPETTSYLSYSDTHTHSLSVAESTGYTSLHSTWHTL